MKKITYVLFTLLLAALIILSGCEGAASSGSTTSPGIPEGPQNGYEGTPILAATFTNSTGNYHFILNDPVSSVRSVSDPTVKTTTGKIKDGDSVYGLSGLIDKDGSFEVAGISSKNGIKLKVFGNKDRSEAKISVMEKTAVGWKPPVETLATTIKKASEITESDKIIEPVDSTQQDAGFPTVMQGKWIRTANQKEYFLLENGSEETIFAQTGYPGFPYYTKTREPYYAEKRADSSGAVSWFLMKKDAGTYWGINYEVSGGGFGESDKELMEKTDWDKTVAERFTYYTPETSHYILTEPSFFLTAVDLSFLSRKIETMPGCPMSKEEIKNLMDKYTLLNLPICELIKNNENDYDCIVQILIDKESVFYQKCNIKLVDTTLELAYYSPSPASRNIFALTIDEVKTFMHLLDEKITLTR